MRIKAYLRVAKTGGSKGYRLAVSTRPNFGSILDSYGDPQPTVAFAILLNIPDEAFKQEVAATLDVPLEALRPADVELEAVVGDDE